MHIYEHTKRVASVSAAFYNAGVSATRGSSFFQDGAVYMNAAAFLASITNFAFSCETALKVQLPFKTQGHLLVELFEQLETCDQNDLIEYVCWESKDREKNQNAAHINVCKSRKDFLILLNESDNIFIDARYIYEGDRATTNYPLWFLRDFEKCALIPFDYDVDEKTGLIKQTKGKDYMTVRLSDDVTKRVLSDLGIKGV